MLSIYLFFKSQELFGIEATETSKREINYSVDNFLDLVRAFDNLDELVTNVYSMEEKSLSSGKLTQTLWSSHSLPLYKGGSANRFNNEEFNRLGSWTQRYKSYQENTVDSFLLKNKANELSPIEKYELIIGGQDYSLTASEWEQGKDSIDLNGVIPSWVGACHGTAPSSISHKRPAKSVTVRAADSRNSVIFYPSDIKALLAYAWATNGGPSGVMGSRCNTFKRTANKGCRDTNPGSFHLALTNLIGIHKKPLIIDTDSGPQVWNRPVISYSFTYFNPQFRNYTRKLSNAIIESAKYTNDPYKNQRAKGTKKILGVRSELEVIDDTEPSTLQCDSAINDKKFKIVYTYDLELDQNGKILGGMWHQPSFPDFVWVVSDKVIPLSSIERTQARPSRVSSSFNQLPDSLRQIGLDSRKNEQISYWIVDYLLDLSAGL